MPFRILSLDGGGIRGVVAAKILSLIEKQIEQPLNEYFNLITGTSTGSILAAAIATGIKSEDIVKLYKQKSSIIFPYQSRFSLKRIRLLFKHGISAPKYSNQGLIKVLKEHFRNKGIAAVYPVPYPDSNPQSHIPTGSLLIIAYDTIERKPIIFKSWSSDKNYGNIPLWEACVSSASAPTYFPAHKLKKIIKGKVYKGSIDAIYLDENTSCANEIYTNALVTITSGYGSGQTRQIKKYIGRSRKAIIDKAWKEIPNKNSTYSIETIFSAIDGGVTANNPSACAVAEALRSGYALDDITVLSIGTGDRTRIIPFEKAHHWGLIQWAQPLIGVALDGSADVCEYVTSQIIQSRQLRLQFKLDRELTGKRLSDDIDDISEENINNLIEAAQTYLRKPKVERSLNEFLEKNK